MDVLTPAVFHILLALADEERHGYGIMLEVGRVTDRKVLMGPGTLYGSLKRMVDAGLVEESGERADVELNSERRKYYRITARGRQALRGEAERLRELVRIARAKSVLKTV